MNAKQWYQCRVAITAGESKRDSRCLTTRVTMLKAAVCAIAICGLITAVVVASDEISIPGQKGLKTFVNRKGASFRFYRENDETSSTISVSFSELNELDASGNLVPGQSGGKGKHTYNAFDKQDFYAETPASIVLPNTNNVSATCVALNATLQDADNATFRAQVCTVSNNGNLNLGNEISTLLEGQLKFTVSVSNWLWSTGGSSLAILINIKIPPGREIKEDKENSTSKHPKKFSFGATASGNFSRMVKVDGSWRNMTGDYPKYSNNGANNYITILIPRFNTIGEYDPTLDPGSSSNYSTRLTSIPLGILFLLMAMINWIH